MDLDDTEFELSLCSEDDEVMNHDGTKKYDNDISSNDSKGTCGYGYGNGNGIDDLVHESDLEDEENTARQNSLVQSQAEECSSEESSMSSLNNNIVIT
jgi:hypothetical protein